MTPSTTDTQTNERTSAFDKYSDPEPPKMLSGRPLGSMILARKVAAKQKEGSIHLAAARETGEAVVIAVGPKVTEVAVGDTVLLHKYSGANTEIEFDGVKYVLVDLIDVLMVL